MSDRRAVSAGHLAASSVAAEPWRVAVGGNRVESMTVEQIAQAFHAGHLSVRTPLWPPGTSGWQALGNFEQFQMAAQHVGAYGDNRDGLSQFEEADDDPTRMWTGSSDLELGGGNMNGMGGMQAPPASPPPVMRPSARTGPREVAQRPPGPPPATQSMRPQPAMAQPPMRMTSSASSVSPSSAPFRRRRSSGWLLVAGLVGLVGLGSAVLAARGSWSAAAPSVLVPTAEAPSTETASAAETTAMRAPEDEEVAAPATAALEAEPPKTEAAEAAQPEAAQLAKYDDTQASAFVAGVEHSKVAEGNAAPTGPAKAERAAAAADTQEVSSAPQRRLAVAHKAEKPERAEKPRAEKEKVEKVVKEREKPAAVSKRAVAAVAAPAPAPAPPKQPKAEAAAPAAEPANASVNEAAAAALATSANLASSCRPRGGPAGAGKARVIYSQDGEVQSVEILTAKFRDTLTGSCVRMVFRRAKIPAFKGEPPTFIKSFTIPEE